MEQSSTVPNVLRQIAGYSLEQELESGPLGTLFLARSAADQPLVAALLGPAQARLPTAAGLVELQRNLDDEQRQLAPGLLLPAHLVTAGSEGLLLLWPRPIGEPLVHAIARGLGSDQCLLLFRSLARLLATLQQDGVQQLALSPGLLFVEFTPDEPQLSLLGPGLARRFGCERSASWPSSCRGYSAPEQRQSDSTVGPQSDVYGLAALVLALLQKSPPPLEPLTALRSLGGLPPPVRELLQQMLRTDPTQRPELGAVSGQLEQLYRRMATTSEVDLAPVAAAEPDDAPKVVEFSDPMIGTTVGNFRILRRIGEGGMGVVYEARHTQIGRRAAVKVLHQSLAQSGEYATHFVNEARAVNIVSHPGLVEIFEYGQLDGGSLFFVMEFLEGQPVSARSQQRAGRPAPLPEAIEIGVQVARALAAAHERGVIHCDLKPENLMLVPAADLPGGERVKILDFGIAKFAPPQKPRAMEDISSAQPMTGPESSKILGTPLYMSPEQFEGAKEVAPPTDVFSFGVILYELLAGALPYPESPIGSMYLTGEPPPLLGKRNPTVPPQLSALVHRMLEVEPGSRPPMSEVAATLEALRPQRRSSRAPLAALAGALLTLVIGGALYLTAQLQRPRTLQSLREPALAALQQSLKSADPSLRQAAVQALGRSRDSHLRILLEPALKDPSTAVATDAALALGEVGAVDSYRPLLALSSANPPGELLLAVADALATLRHPKGLELLQQLLGGSDETLRVQAATRLLSYGEKSGAPMLRERIAHLPPSDPAAIQALGRLASAGDDDARQRLGEQLRSASGASSRAYIAWTLARIGDDRARAELAQLGSRSGPDELLAARLLASLGEPCKDQLFVDQALDPKSEEAIRLLALEGLGDCRGAEPVAALGQLLADRESGERLRVAAASAVLQRLASGRSELAQHSLDWAQAALRSDSLAARQLAVAMLGDLDQEQATEALALALTNSDLDVRRDAAAALGRKRGKAATTALLGALRDRDSAVLLSSVQSFRQVIASSKGTPAAAELAGLREPLQQLLSASQELPRVVASGLLYLLGDSSQQAALLRARSSADPQVRRMALELGPAQEDSLTAALQDGDGAVRLTAARRLVELGSQAATSLLRELLASNGPQAMEAFRLLQKLGEKVALPPTLSDWATAPNLTRKRELVDAALELPAELGSRLLNLASIDPSPLIRRQAVQVASALYQRSRQPTHLNLIRNLALDSDLAVRSAAVEALTTLSTLTPTAAAQPESDSPAADKPAAATPASGEGGAFLQLTGEEQVSVRLDGSRELVVTGKPVAVPPGHHVLSFAGGSREFVVAAGETKTVPIPVTLLSQSLNELKTALQGREYEQAQQVLNRLRQLAERGRTPASVQADLHFYQARLYEARGRVDGALYEYDLFIASGRGGRKSELIAAAKKSLSRLSANRGRIQIFTFVDGQCRLSSEQLRPPGEQLISVGGTTRHVWSQSGVVSKVSFCP